MFEPIEPTEAERDRYNDLLKNIEALNIAYEHVGSPTFPENWKELVESYIKMIEKN
jgi:hypothetical protein